MKESKLFDCNICKAKVDVINGGVALMMAMCIKSTANFCNIALCEKCYKAFVEKPLKELNEKARVGLWFGEETE